MPSGRLELCHRVVVRWNALVLVICKKIGELVLDKIQVALGRISPRSGTSMASIHNLSDIDDADLVKLEPAELT